MGNQDRVTGGDDVPGHAEEPGRGVDEAEVETTRGDAAEEGADAGEVRAHAAAAGLVVAGLAAGDEGKGFQPGRDDEPLHRDAGIRQVVVKSRQQTGLTGQRETDGALGIGIDQQGFDARTGEGVGEVYRDSGFTHASLLT